MFRRALTVLGMLLFASSFAFAEDKPAEKVAAQLTMAAKLKFATIILEGLTNDDLDRVLDGARAMNGLNELEAFVRRRNPAYTAQLNVFRTSTDGVVAAAESKNLDGAALAFTQLTVSCVNCHKTLRAPAK